MLFQHRFFVCLLIVVGIGLGGCAQPVMPVATRTSTPAFSSPSPTQTSTSTATLQPSSTPTRTLPPTPTPSPTITLTPEPLGCQAPPEDYTRMEVNGWLLNRRTYAMLQHAAELYHGDIEITGYSITQGSYHDNGAASFGTYLGGGAVDLSVMRKGTWQVAKDDIEPLIHALRVSGFAAWLRLPDELYSGSPIHIHAIAIGDKELSQPAQDQLTGPHGYFYGYTGLPDGDPAPDRHGGPVLCQWMIDLGYKDLRQPTPAP